MPDINGSLTFAYRSPSPSPSAVHGRSRTRSRARAAAVAAARDDRFQAGLRLGVAWHGRRRRSRRHRHRRCRSCGRRGDGHVRRRIHAGEQGAGAEPVSRTLNPKVARYLNRKPPLSPKLEPVEHPPLVRVVTYGPDCGRAGRERSTACCAHTRPASSDRAEMLLIAAGATRSARHGICVWERASDGRPTCSARQPCNMRPFVRQAEGRWALALVLGVLRVLCALLPPWRDIL